MSDIKIATETFIAEICDTEVYRTYEEELQKVKRVQELKAQIDDFRKRNYEFQSSPDIDFQKLDQFEKEYQNFRQNPLVADFLAAELALCRMLQDISERIVKEINFE